MQPSDITIEILQGIRDEIRLTRTDLSERLDQTNARLDQTNGRLDQTNGRLDELSRRVVESEVRTSTAITDLAGTMRDLTVVLRAQGELRPRVEKCERDIDELRRRVPRR